jgi:Type II secretion system (T2SS), protein E, N-terminal domain
MNHIKHNQKESALTSSKISSWPHHLKKHAVSAYVSSDACDCLPPSQMHSYRNVKPEKDTLGDEQGVLISQKLYSELQPLLSKMLVPSTPLSVLLLHISQIVSPPLAPGSSSLYKRLHYHASPELLSQVCASVQKTIRANDKLFIYGDGGVAFVFPDVDERGLQQILERVYGSVSLLQSETMIPPLTRETTVVLGGGTYPDPASSLSALLQQMGQVVHRLILRPAITTQLRGVTPLPASDTTLNEFIQVSGVTTVTREASGIPYLELPKVLPEHLTQLIPYQVALELQCVPVGREHRNLTVAMVDPTNKANITRLEQITDLVIFPVTCDGKELKILLSRGW